MADPPAEESLAHSDSAADVAQGTDEAVESLAENANPYPMASKETDPSLQTSGMEYSEEGVYDNTPAQQAHAQNLTMDYSEEGVYDNPPALQAAAAAQDGVYGNLQTPTGMQYSEEGAYDNPAAVMAQLEAPVVKKDRAPTPEPPPDQPAKKGKKTKAVKLKGGHDDTPGGAFDYEEKEPIVHKSALRKAKEDGGSYTDPEAGQPCLVCGDKCPGFEPHMWRKVCNLCRCHRYEHMSSEVAQRRSDSGSHEEVMQLQKALVGESEALDLKRVYAWVPLGASGELIQQYFASISEKAVPRIGSDGELWRQRQLQLQMPPYDTNHELCDQMSAIELEYFKAFDELRLKECFDIGEVIACPDLTKPTSCDECFLKDDGSHWPFCSKFVEPDLSTIKAQGVVTPSQLYEEQEQRSIKDMKRKSKEEKSKMRDELVKKNIKRKKKELKAKAVAAEADAGPQPAGGKCRGCTSDLIVGEVVVSVERFEEGVQYFHPQCFTCSQCFELLVDLRCYVDVGQEERGRKGAEQRLFCGRHWADNSKKRCHGCDETVHEEKHIWEMDVPWHFRHFCCYICDRNLTKAATYIPQEGRPLCFACYAEHVADKCVSCSGSINPQAGKLTVKDRHWHVACFCCKVCGTSLNGKPCVPKGDILYCKKCYKKLKKKSKEQ